MTDEEFAKKLVNVPLPVFATGLLNLELNRESAFAEAVNASNVAEIDLLKLPDDERRKLFGAKVRIMRRLLGLTQTALAKKLGVTTQAVAAYEAGKREPPFKNLIGLSRALNVSVDWLIGNETPITQ